ncbi:MerR family transcriptional regulator [Saccharopolyspora griseoalba]|uniref:MerR family transcriptional regulator n=1 Tax=Saccharopolyspora griseoalba TaxID=1431848 RepID=A0ABW2LQJ5_9PSEU
MSDRSELLSIGELARRTGMAVRTIRFWSDSGVITPTTRSGGGYRLYDATAVARVELVRTLRELGLDLDSVRRVLSSRETVQDVAEAHLEALDAEIRTLQVRRAVLRWVARRGSTTEELRLMNDVARMSADERQRIIDDFVREAFAGVEEVAPGSQIAQAMRTMPATLPDYPSAEQVEAWVELADLVGDADFRARVREMAVAGAQPQQLTEYDPQEVIEHVPAAVEAGIAPESTEGQQVLHRLIDPAMTAEQRRDLAERMTTFTDRRVERYWQLLGVLNDWPNWSPRVPAFEWVIAALRA